MLDSIDFTYIKLISQSLQSRVQNISYREIWHNCIYLNQIFMKTRLKIDVATASEPLLYVSNGSNAYQDFKQSNQSDQLSSDSNESFSCSDPPSQSLILVSAENQMVYPNHQLTQDHQIESKKQQFQQEDPEINRIMLKLLSKQSSHQKNLNTALHGNIKIDAVNQLLAKENASIIAKIAQIKTKCIQINNAELHNKSHRANNNPKDLFSTLKIRFSKAEQLKSRLQLRIADEKTRSRLIKKSLKSVQNAKSTIKLISQPASKPKQAQQKACDHCCKKIDHKRKYSKSMLNEISPVLQFNSYTIASELDEQKIQEFILHKVQTKDSSCQVQMDQDDYQNVLKKLKDEEVELNRKIDENNLKISMQEENLMKLIAN